jgi:hypothetical protein
LNIPNIEKNPENDVLDIGWAEGNLSDGWPYRMECWAGFLEKEGLVAFYNWFLKYLKI